MIVTGIVVAGTSIALAGYDGGKPVDSDKGILGLRPEHITLAAEAEPGRTIPATVEIHIDLIKGYGNRWPQLETEDKVMFIGSARPMEDAARIAYRELVLWMEAEYGFDRWDAYMMLSQCGQVRLGNFVDPKYTVGAAITKKYLAPEGV